MNVSEFFIKNKKRFKNFVEILDNIYADLLELERVHSQALKANTNRRKAIL